MTPDTGPRGVMPQGPGGMSGRVSVLVVRGVGEPVDDVGIGHDDRLRLVSAVVLDDVESALVRALLRGRACARCRR